MQQAYGVNKKLKKNLFWSYAPFFGLTAFVSP